MLTFFINFTSSFFITFFATKIIIMIMEKRAIGQPIREEGPQKHYVKSGTPTLGGIAIVIGIIGGYLLPKLIFHTSISYSVVMCMWSMIGMGTIGLIDDLIKLLKMNNLGLRARTKLILQLIVVAVYYFISFQKIYILHHPTILLRSFMMNYLGLGSDSNILSLFSHSYITVPLFLCFTYFLVSGITNAVNLTDGLDGLAIGAIIFVFLAYSFIALWENNQSCENFSYNCYSVYDSRDISTLCISGLGASTAFLWWNATPAKIFMGDVGAFALGGVISSLAMALHMVLISFVVNGLFIIIALSVILQVLSFKLFGKRIFKMAPLQHHFELLGWSESNIVIRFWIIAGFFALLGLAILYAEWVYALYTFH